MPIYVLMTDNVLRLTCNFLFHRKFFHASTAQNSKPLILLRIWFEIDQVSHPHSGVTIITTFSMCTLVTMHICLNISAFAILENGAFAFSILIISASDAPSSVIWQIFLYLYSHLIVLPLYCTSLKSSMSLLFPAIATIVFGDPCFFSSLIHVFNDAKLDWKYQQAVIQIQSSLAITRPVITLIGCNAVGRASRFFGR